MKATINLETFYRSSEWVRKKKQILRRDGYLCQECKRYGRLRAATTVHHIKHLDAFPELALENTNLISLCGRCHNTEHPEKALARNRDGAMRYE